MNNHEKPGGRKNPPPLIRDEQPLLRMLVAQATRRGQTLAGLAKTLGVTYERLAQWRRGEAGINRAHKSVHEKAAAYLGVPTIVVLMLAGGIELPDFVWPGEDSLEARVNRELERLHQDPLIGAFAPSELFTANPAVKLFVTFLLRELEGEARSERPTRRWLTALHHAAIGNAQGQLDLEALRKESVQNTALF